MRYPLRIAQLKIRHKPVHYIILHHTYCQYPIPQIKLDSPKYQLDHLFNQVMEQKIPDVNYHAVISRVKDEYVASFMRPYVTLCDYPDIDDKYNDRAIHIALLGNYDLDLPDKRAYEIMVYRVISPFSKLLGLSHNRIYLHNELSNNEEESCPGELFSKRIVINYMRRFMIR